MSHHKTVVNYSASSAGAAWSRSLIVEQLVWHYRILSLHFNIELRYFMVLITFYKLKTTSEIYPMERGNSLKRSAFTSLWSSTSSTTLLAWCHSWKILHLKMNILWRKFKRKYFSINCINASAFTLFETVIFFRFLGWTLRKRNCYIKFDVFSLIVSEQKC